ncbi:TetR/AcrR family transcriptional regulator [Actinokineospora sp. PR83]|uniref:TetR/AcrR family transcriptional regulator n=1 Tax=Actinokineospora sp. PR83 TaxID=2884908 RepID=UPI001F1DFB72|nr:TetR/AcrR family transcriptional regulator [Actinokineospora sp. PR83]MCG8914509.1 TetR/AcrR family transcriptional regulator [Actinokineospora sp. PR83]
MAGADSTTETGRVDRRKVRTRRALIEAAKRLITEGRSSTASIQQITDTADIGFGSFYNHFSSKEELFHAATAAVLEEWAQLIEDATKDVGDPAERFATSFRISARLAWTHPALADVLNRFGLDLLELQDGLGPRAMRDIQDAVAAGRFTVSSLPLALSTVGGALLGFLRLKTSHPALVDPSAVEDLARQMLQMLGISPEEAVRICAAPLPELPTTTSR